MNLENKIKLIKAQLEPIKIGSIVFDSKRMSLSFYVNELIDDKYIETFERVLQELRIAFFVEKVEKFPLTNVSIIILAI